MSVWLILPVIVGCDVLAFAWGWRRGYLAGLFQGMLLSREQGEQDEDSDSVSDA